MSWHDKEEFQHFKNTTLGFPVIMGRVTFESLGKPLKNRLNVVVSSRPYYSLPYEDVKIYRSLTEAVETVKKLNPGKIFIIGGGEIYRQAINFADEMIISIMKFDAEGDVYFPKIDPDVWRETSREKRERFDIITYAKN